MKLGLRVTGTLINTATVLLGSTVGTFLQSRFPERVRQMVMWGVGLISLVIGMQMSLTTKNILMVLGSLLTGGICGEILRLHERLKQLRDTLQSRLSVATDSRFSKGFVTASSLFCAGPMTILGALQDGLSGDCTLLASKAIRDGFAALALATSLVKTFLTDAMVAELTATGGTLILAIGLNLLDLTMIRIVNFLPALVIAPMLVA